MIERFVIKYGKWGAYHYDTEVEKDMTLQEVTNLLNLENQQEQIAAISACVWKWDEEKKRWHTGCRAYHYSAFDKDETMRRLRFCPFCSHTIRKVK